MKPKQLWTFHIDVNSSSLLIEMTVYSALLRCVNTSALSDLYRIYLYSGN